MKKKNSNFTFSRVPSVVRPRSVFDRSRTYKTAFNAGLLIPFYCDEILPGDTIANLNVTAFARLTTPVVPFMDNLWMDFHFFFVPYRLVWDNWVRFCGEQDNPDDSTDFLVPQTTVGSSLAFVGSLYDYFGLPVGKEMTVNSLMFRAYNLIWNEFYRDENLQASIEVHRDSDGPDPSTDFSVQPRGKRKADPFTSALPWPQKGPGVELPIGGYAPVGAMDSNSAFQRIGLGYQTSSPISMPANSAGNIPVGTVGGNSYVGSIFKSGSAQTFPLEENGASSYKSLPLYADLGATTAVTINSLREAFQIQKWYEQLARGGSRYQELLLSMFGTDAGDARLQRPEYLGGGTVPIQVHAVAQTSSTDATTPQGNMAAFGVAGGSGIGFSKSFVEHGCVIGLVSVRGDYTYQQGIDRFWSRRTKFDFYWPAFAHLGEVPILNKELYYSNDSSLDNAAFGYQERWYEYRYGISKITGKLRSGVTGSLDVWHLAQNFANLPTLSNDFIVENPPISRVLAVQNEPQFIFDSVIKCRHARVMPTYSVPGLVDHF